MCMWIETPSGQVTVQLCFEAVQEIFGSTAGSQPGRGNCPNFENGTCDQYCPECRPEHVSSASQVVLSE